MSQLCLNFLIKTSTKTKLLYIYCYLINIVMFLFRRVLRILLFYTKNSNRAFLGKLNQIHSINFTDHQKHQFLFILINIVIYLGGCYSSTCGDSDYDEFAKQYPGNHYQQCCEKGELQQNFVLLLFFNVDITQDIINFLNKIICFF